MKDKPLKSAPRFSMDYGSIEKAIGAALTERIMKGDFYRDLKPMTLEKLNKQTAGGSLLGAEPIQDGPRAADWAGVMMYFKRPGGGVAIVEISRDPITGEMSMNGANMK